ncbi:hypothetical protein BKA61DRAFT_677947 [Leptodontidium sp. MPI-SDFR-AT-0119]|nr:hypothetical protein BKA61DRAFT_677947 [Leptodontidium sp. MPI-SDFR-AT-0119]
MASPDPVTFPPMAPHRESSSPSRSRNASSIFVASSPGQSSIESTSPPENSQRPDRAWKPTVPTFENTTDQVTFLVGSSQKEFKVYRDHALKSSEILFRFFTNPSSSESQTQTMRLPEISPTVFELWIQYIYSPMNANGNRVFPSRLYMQYNESHHPTWKESQEIYEKLFGLWYLADYLCMRTLQNDTMFAIADCVQHITMLPSRYCLDEIDRDLKLDSGRPPKNLLIDLYATGAKFEKDEEIFALWPSRLLARLHSRRSFFESNSFDMDDYMVVEIDRDLEAKV